MGDHLAIKQRQLVRSGSHLVVLSNPSCIVQKNTKEEDRKKEKPKVNQPIKLGQTQSYLI